MDLYTAVRTELGTLAVGFGERGITRVVLPRGDWRDVDHAELARLGLAKAERVPPNIARVARALGTHIAGQPQDFSGAPLDTSGSPPFLLRVQRAAQAIPPGQTLTYGELALRVGSPRAARAVGQAMATNPWAIVVPCHRVFGRSGFGDYSAGGGLHTKLRLLWREGYRGRTSNVSFDEHAAVAHLRAADPRLATVIDRAGPFTLQAASPHPRGGVGPFTALARAIVSQQLSGRVAMTIYGRVAALTGDGAIDDAKAVLALSKAKLRAAGLSENKALALRDLAEHAAAGTLPSRAEMQSMSDQEIVDALARIRGIGRWSAQMLLMFYLGRPNVLPVADLGVQKGFNLVYGCSDLPSAAALERAALAWAPYTSVASWYLWRAVEMKGYFA
jgi:methylated-DNA-[protein]-cysteine S-methyltransferase